MSTRTVRETLEGYARGIAGGLLFSIAPLYTMEIWWQGYITPPKLMLFTSVAMLVVLVAYAHYAGINESESLKDNVLEAFQVVALGTGLAALILKLAGQLPAGIELYEAFCRITIEGTTCAVGVAVGSTQLGADPDEGEGESSGKREKKKKGSITHEFAFAVLGAVLISLGVAPTQEVTMIAVEAAPWAVLVTALLTFVMGLLVVNYSKFKGSKRLEEGIFAGGPIGDGVVTYALALVVSAAMLWITGRFGSFGLTTAVYQTVFLAVPATLGAAAGRLLL